MPAGNIGRYQVEAELGRGGSGTVYRAFDATVNRAVAVKVLRSSDRQLVSRFRREAATSAHLAHKNIVSVYDFGEHEGSLYLVTELLEGKTLREVIASRQPAPLLEKLNWMTQVGSALAYAHANGVVHRDVKPANIFILPDGTVKLMDFGIAQMRSDDEELGYVAGTLAYMAPEQLRGEGASPRSDIWSYGVVFYELLSGTNPFNDKDQSRTMYLIAEANPQPLQSVVPECPESLENVVHRALLKDVELRYQNLEDLLLDLEPIMFELRREKAAGLVAVGQKLVSGGDLEGAARATQEILELDPGNREARALHQSVRVAMQGIALRPKIDALVKDAERDLANRRYAEAIQAFEAALRLDAGSTEIRSRLAQTRELLERERTASQRISEAQQAIGSGDLDRALALASDAVAADPDNQRAAEIAATIKQEIGRRDEETAAPGGNPEGRWSAVAPGV